MKVNIGKPKHWWTTQRAEEAWYRLRYKKYAWEIKKKERDSLDRAVEKFLDIWHATVNTLVNKTWGRRPVAEYVRIEPWDTWSADHTLALIILPTLKQIREDKHGAPNTDDEDVPEDLRSTAAPPLENEYDADENHFKRWDWILDEMIWAFEQLVDDEGEQQFYSGNHDVYFAPVDMDGNDIDEDEAELYEMRHGPNNTFSIDTEGLQAYNDRIDNGLRLFGKYYRALWT